MIERQVFVTWHTPDEKLPPAHPEKHTGKRTETHACDCIERQAAIDDLDEWIDIYGENKCVDAQAILKQVKRSIKKLPSAQPEQLTDKEQRIFLAAMGREEKVCKQVDNEWRDCREPYEDSLVRTCHEITRKVKGALWTI